MENDNIEEMLTKVRNQRRQKLFDQRVALLKAEDAFNELGGEDDYELSLSAIVTAYPKGITLTRVREVFPNSKALEDAKEVLKNKGLIEVGTDKRSPLLTPKATNTKSADKESGDPVQALPTSKKAAPKSTKSTDEEPED